MTDDGRRGQIVGVALAACGATCFSLKGVAMKLALEAGGGVEQMMALRMGLALPIYLAVGAAAATRSRGERVGPAMLAAAVLLGILSYVVCTWLDFTGLKFISAQLERLILFLYPTITALLAWAFLGDRVTLRHGIALAASYAGVALLAAAEISRVGADAAIGAGLVFAAAVLFAVNVVASKPVIDRLGPALYTSVAMSAAAIVIVGVFAAQVASGGAPATTPRLIWIGAFLAIVGTVAPSFMISAAIARIGPGQSSAVGGVGPAVAALAAVLVLGEAFGPPQAMALALTVGGVLLLARDRPNNPPSDEKR